jgi:menaquinone-dependent protoporphyrinogen oxidase
LKTLIAFGTRYGATVDTAERIATGLREEGIETDVVNLKRQDVDDFSVYYMVVIGSGIKASRWIKESAQFLKDHEEELQSKITALFVSSGSWPFTTGDGEMGAEQEGGLYSKLGVNKEKAYQEYVVDKANEYGLNPDSIEVFGGFWDFDAMGFLWRLLLRGLRKDLEAQGVDTDKPYDNRNLERITRWAKELVALVKS